MKTLFTTLILTLSVSSFALECSNVADGWLSSVTIEKVGTNANITLYPTDASKLPSTYTAKYSAQMVGVQGDSSLSGGAYQGAILLNLNTKNKTAVLAVDGQVFVGMPCQ